MKYFLYSSNLHDFQCLLSHLYVVIRTVNHVFERFYEIFIILI